MPVDAFYERKKIGTGKQPYAWSRPMANRSRWRVYGSAGEIREAGDVLQSFTIITTVPNELLRRDP